jgi:hypothetical protein
MKNQLRILSRVTVCCLLVAAVPGVRVPLAAQSDLNTFMREVLATRDDNWKKLQQYVLDEREQFEIQGPNHTPIYGEKRDYTWFIREGFFVRSPLRVNGGAVPDGERRKAEDDYLRREKRREARTNAPAGDRAPVATPEPPEEAPGDLDAFIRQTRQPQFISSAYFLKFKFDEGRYALVGREALDGRQALKIEYYPAKLFEPDPPRNRDGDTDEARRRRERSVALEAQMLRLMNKTSKVTLWIDPASHQILKYVFDDLGWNFLPAPWIVRVSDMTASMSMGEMFPGIWLPRSLDMHFGMLMAAGTVDGYYSLDYDNYRQPDVTATVGVPGQR